MRKMSFLLILIVLVGCKGNQADPLPLPPASETELSEEMLAFCGTTQFTDLMRNSVEEGGTVYLVYADGSGMTSTQVLPQSGTTQVDDMGCEYIGKRDEPVRHELMWDNNGETLYAGVATRVPHGIAVSSEGMLDIPYPLWDWQNAEVRFDRFYGFGISPDNQQLALIADPYEFGDSSQYIWIADLNGNNFLKLTESKPVGVNLADPRWSPDGEWIASTVIYNDNGLIVVKSDGSQRFEIVESAMPGTFSTPRFFFIAANPYNFAPSWYPDSQRVLFIAATPDHSRASTLFRYDLDSGQLTQLIDKNVYTPVVSPTGEWIAYVRYIGERTRRKAAIMLVDEDGQRAVELIRFSQVDKRNMLIQDLVWSPDGTRLAFSSNHEGDMDIYVMNADGSGLFNVTNREGFEIMPRWRPHKPVEQVE